MPLARAGMCSLLGSHPTATHCSAGGIARRPGPPTVWDTSDRGVSDNSLTEPPGIDE